MNISAPFIHRPIATALLMVGLLVGGLVAYPLLPVAALPNVNYPTLTVTAQLPGRRSADHGLHGGIAARDCNSGEIPGLTQMTSASALGYTQITLQFELNRQIDGAVSDTLSAINAANAYLPAGLPYPPMIRKVNPADTPILVLGITSDSLPLTVCRRLCAKYSAAKDLADIRRRPRRHRRYAAADRPRPGRSGGAGGSRHQPRGCAHGARPGECRPSERARSTARARPTRSIPTISCSSPTNTPTSSSPIATDRRSASAISAAPSARARTS